ncbi:4-phosphoerythronate dehydrogenase PdxB [Marinobacterium mangrovicola]|uniref:Erythronate-4-phosphate dehydrogenase n=1 Tax=Marinobacterium mangrovicola TaxID=1476959 RepID=A0A4R1GE95_9GAMM|nr:4-phosphoerythronate dehydrogenase PdxB [Marinobacterium mangrovicola]TCK02542.1 4-phosphoerythronate dehydrogenase [Marinobacterium mangrovicola]
MSGRLKIVADENIPALEPLFGELGDLVRLPGRSMSPSELADADLLLVRSVTRVNAELLAGSRIGFVGTATIGTDHLDIGWLEQQKIQWCSAPGCNADAVVEYVLSVLWHLADEQGFDPLSRTFAVIGAGNVGGRLVERLRALGIKVLVCDPPRAEKEGKAGFVSLEEALAQADFISLHTPLVKDGQHPSHHLLNESNLDLIQQNAILLNAGRGPVIDNRALELFMQQRSDISLVLDVWEHEPAVSPALASHCRIATPHIAGYSLEGKIRGTWMLYREVCRWLGREAALSLESVLPMPEVERIYCNGRLAPLKPIALTYDPYRDDRALRATLDLPEPEQRLAFDRLRKQYPVRREFSSLEVDGLEDETQDRLLRALGFRRPMA